MCTEEDMMIGAPHLVNFVLWFLFHQFLSEGRISRSSLSALEGLRHCASPVQWQEQAFIVTSEREENSVPVLQAEMRAALSRCQQTYCHHQAGTLRRTCPWWAVMRDKSRLWWLASTKEQKSRLITEWWVLNYTTNSTMTLSKRKREHNLFFPKRITYLPGEGWQFSGGADSMMGKNGIPLWQDSSSPPLRTEEQIQWRAKRSLTAESWEEQQWH